MPVNIIKRFDELFSRLVDGSPIQLRYDYNGNDKDFFNSADWERIVTIREVDKIDSDDIQGMIDDLQDWKETLEEEEEN